MTATVTLREATANALNHTYPGLLPADFEKKPRGRGFQCTYQIADVAKLAENMQTLSRSHSDGAIRASLRSDLTKLRASTSIPDAKPAAKKAGATAGKIEDAPVTDPEFRAVKPVDVYTHYEHTCECGKGWNGSGVAHCKVCHVSYGDAQAMLAHNTGDHTRFRPCLHPSEMNVTDNGSDVWVSAA